MKLPHRHSSGFILLEVIVSLVILGVSIATLMRSFTLSMRAIRQNDITTQACVLAEGLLQDLDLNPPQGALTNGDFSEKGYPNYSYVLKYEEEEIRYKHLKTKSRIENLRPLQHATITVTYDDKRMHRFSAIQLDLYLPPIERFSYESKFRNELFMEGQKR